MIRTFASTYVMLWIWIHEIHLP